MQELKNESEIRHAKKYSLLTMPSRRPIDPKGNAEFRCQVKSQKQPYDPFLLVQSVYSVERIRVEMVHV